MATMCLRRRAWLVLGLGVGTSLTLFWVLLLRGRLYPPPELPDPPSATAHEPLAAAAATCALHPPAAAAAAMTTGGAEDVTGAAGGVGRTPPLLGLLSRYVDTLISWSPPVAVPFAALAYPLKRRARWPIILYPPPPRSPLPTAYAYPANMTKQDLAVVLHNNKRGLLTIEGNTLDVLQLSADGRPPQRLLSCPLRLVLRVRLGTDTDPSKSRRLDLFTLCQKNSKSTDLRLRKIHVLVEPSRHADAAEWVDGVMQKAYPVTRPFRHVLMLVNPVGGKGKGSRIVNNQIMPLLEAAGCKVDRRVTTHSGHAEELTSTLDLEQYDVIAKASGDGGVYEVLNGLAKRPDARRALRTPIAPIPTGSACAASTNVFGIKDTFNIPLATLNIIKGQPFAVDLCSVLLLPSMERRVSFLSIALGLMVDIDIGTEHLRWMGDARFVYGFVRGVLQSRACKARLKMDVITDDKELMAREARESAAQERGSEAVVVGGGTDPLSMIRTAQLTIAAASKPAPAAVEVQTLTRDAPPAPANGHANGNGKAEPEALDDGPLPPAHVLEPTADWVTIESQGTKSQSTGQPVSAKNSGGWLDGDDMVFFYAGLMPWVSRDLNQWPVIKRGSGVIDVAIQRVAPRMLLLESINGAENGDPFWLDCLHYYKVRSFIAENLDKVNQPILAIDGEAFPWDSIHVEVLPRAATFLSLDGHFYHSKFVNSTYSGVKKTKGRT